MNKREIISEGYLEAYISGDLDEKTSSEIELLISSNDEIRAAYYAIEKKIELLSFHCSKKPSSKAKQKLMENPAIMNMHTIQDQVAPVGFSWLSVAASLVTISSMILSIYFWNQWQSTDADLTALIEEKSMIAQNFQQASQQLANMKSDIAVLVNPAFSRLILKGTDNSPEAEAVLYWNAEEQSILLNSASLAVLSDDQQYQLWALLDGKPVDAGTFDARSGQFQLMKNIAAADAFAITIEPKGGSENPTLSTMQVFGST